MARKTVILTSTSRVDIGTLLLEAMQTELLRNVRTRVLKAVDKEMTHLFRFVSSQTMGQSNFATLRPYIPRSGWKDYHPDYAKRKKKMAKHLRWFSYGFDKNGNPAGDTLSRDFDGVSESEALRALGNSTLVISRDKKNMTIKLAPKVRWRIYNMEMQLQNLLKSETITKLQSTKKTYRPMLGPVFLYFRAVRIPRAVRVALRNL